MLQFPIWHRKNPPRRRRLHTDAALGAAQTRSTRGRRVWKVFVPENPVSYYAQQTLDETKQNQRPPIDAVLLSRADAQQRAQTTDARWQRRTTSTRATPSRAAGPVTLEEAINYGRHQTTYLHNKAE